MDVRPQFLMTDPRHFDVRYRINPWMKPEAWSPDRAAEACAASAALRAAIEAAGGQVEVIPGAPDLPDLVFPANAAVVLDRRVLIARFRHPERRGEETLFKAAFEDLQRRGLVDAVLELPEGVFHEGAGDAIWDAGRGFFWGGYGPRSSREALAVIEVTFGQETVPLELATDRFYHLDTCFCPLAGGEVLYYPPAFTEEALAQIHAHVPESLRIEASDAEAAAICVNAVNLDRRIVMARSPATLRSKLDCRGYRLVEVDLDPFILSGGAAYCMTLRLDRTSVPAPSTLAPERPVR